mmetsp:Transcript_7997/g.8138  ORF Transcript_7997/g.8138 Transcript_7997/m.8138 type:complete len:82 (-) Transcript_7997:382-627(-)
MITGCYVLTFHVTYIRSPLYLNVSHVLPMVVQPHKRRKMDEEENSNPDQDPDQEQDHDREDGDDEVEEGDENDGNNDTVED